VLETAHHVCDGLGLADVGEELVSETLALGGPGDETGDIDEGHGRRHDALGLHDLRERPEARVRHRHHPQVGVHGAKRIIRGSDRGLCQGIEERGFTDIRQTDDAAAKTHLRVAPLIQRSSP
jgi:hypothetical protein